MSPYLEKISLPAKSSGECEACFIVFRHALILDTKKGRSFLVSFSNDGNDQIDKLASEQDSIAFQLSQLAAPFNPDSDVPQPDRDAGESELSTSLTEPDFFRSVARLKEYIRQGEIFQCVLSLRHTMQAPKSPFQLLDPRLKKPIALPFSLLSHGSDHPGRVSRAPSESRRRRCGNMPHCGDEAPGTDSH